MSALIEVHNISYYYALDEHQAIPALNDLSLSVDRGEYTVVIGANGSGKSTLARHLNALLVPATGKVWVDGLLTSEPENKWEIRRRVGMVFQNPDNQIVATTVEEDVAFGLENLGVPPSLTRQRVDGALRLVGLEEYTTHAPHLLSGGQKQRLAIAGVIAMEPSCLVMDEPTTMLDPRGRKEVLQTVREMNRQRGITVVHITHFMEEALLADRVLVMEAGRIAAQGAPVDIFGGDLELEPLGLEAPAIPRLARLLRAGGLDIPRDALDVGKLVSALC